MNIFSKKFSYFFFLLFLSSSNFLLLLKSNIHFGGFDMVHGLINKEIKIPLGDKNKSSFFLQKHENCFWVYLKVKNVATFNDNTVRSYDELKNKLKKYKRICGSLYNACLYKKEAEEAKEFYFVNYKMLDGERVFDRENILVSADIWKEIN
jgi:hypothetical protein